MCKVFIGLISAILILNGANTSPLTKCKADDDKCIKDATNIMIPLFVKGMPEYGVEVLDPLHIDKINASQGNIVFTLTDVTSVGLGGCKATKAKRDVKNSKIHVTLECPSTTLEGQYVLDGTVVVVPVRGSGKIHVELKSAVFELELDTVEKTGNDGKKHWHIKSFAHPFHMKEKSVVIFENLNGNNELLRQASSDLLRENGNDVVREIGFPVIQLVIARAVKNMNHFFKAVPIEELSFD